jgi:hypothetical protein
LRSTLWPSAKWRLAGRGRATTTRPCCAARAAILARGAGRHRRGSRRRCRVLCAANRADPDQPRNVCRAGGDFWPVVCAIPFDDDDLDPDRAHRQRHDLWSCRQHLDARSRHRPQARAPHQGRHGVDQHSQFWRSGTALWRLQTIRLAARGATKLSNFTLKSKQWRRHCRSAYLSAGAARARPAFQAIAMFIRL